MKMKRITLTLLLAAMLILTACGSQSGTISDTAAAADTVIEIEDTVNPLADNLPEEDYGGYDFRIMSDNDYIFFIYAEELNGSQINDVLYEANRAVEERYNIRLSQVVQSTWTANQEVETPILAGDDAFDTAFIHDIGAGNLSLKGLFINLYDMPYLDFSKPWWPSYTVDSLTLNGQMYLISNYISYYGFHSTRTIFFNRDMVNSYGLPSPYELVDNNEWTLDKLISMTKDVYDDKNGNGVVDKEDIYGFAMTVPYCLFENFGFEAWGKTEDGSELFLDTYSDKTVALMDKLCDWLVSGRSGCFYSASHSDRYGDDSSNTWFSEGRVLYTYGAIGHLIKGLLTTETNYGILPMPKTTETQTDYICACTELPGIIPITTKETDRTGMLIEALSAESYRQVIPRYYEYALKGRYANDPESVKMLDIMFKNRVLSFSYIYGGGGSCFQQIVNNVLTNKGNFASYYESNKSKEEARIAVVMEFFAKK